MLLREVAKRVNQGPHFALYPSPRRFCFLQMRLSWIAYLDDFVAPSVFQKTN
jgi:hypothetical protein